ncbi:hypothetical protein DITRI_Ditri12bG0162900 [Diplodiscus trichospermus]
MSASMVHACNGADKNSVSIVRAYNKVEDCNIAMGLAYNNDDENIMSIGDTYERENYVFMSMGQSYNKSEDSATTGSTYKESDNAIAMSNTFNKGDNNFMSMGQTYNSIDDSSVTVGHTYVRGGVFISFGGYDDDDDINPSGRLISAYDLLMGRPFSQRSDAPNDSKLVKLNADALNSTGNVGT